MTLNMIYRTAAHSAECMPTILCQIMWISQRVVASYIPIVDSYIPYDKTIVLVHIQYTYTYRVGGVGGVIWIVIAVNFVLITTHR